MGTVVAMPISISDKGKALCAIEAERQELYAQARRITQEQQQIMEAATTNIQALGRQHELILSKLAALDDTADKLVNA